MLTSVQAKLDDDVEALIREIKERYAPGKACNDPKHGTVTCFIHAPTNQHFDISFHPCVLQWAAKIVSPNLWLDSRY